MSKEVEILIAEENSAESEHLKHILEQHDYRVSIEHNGRAALEAARAHQPQIVISAILLPEMDGYELCRQIKTDEKLKHIPVLLLTSLSDAADIIRGMECGADNFVTKPYDEQLLISRLEYILLNRELRSAGAGTQIGVEVLFKGEKYSITPERRQMVDLLLSTYETAVQKNLELERAQTELNRVNEGLKEKIEESAREIEERQLAEASLREQQEFLREVIDANPNPVFVKDSEGRFTLVNEAMATLYGTTTTEIVGKTDIDLNGRKEEVERILRLDKEVIETAQKIHIPEEEFTDLKTGEVNWFQMVRTPLVKSNGKVKQILGVATDITERKRAEDKLRRRELELSDYFENATIGLHWVGGDGIIKWANRAELDLLGYAPEEYIGHHIAEFHAEQEVIDNILQRLTGDEALHDHEARMRCKDGTFRTVLINSNVFREDDKFVHTRCFTRDITQRKQAQDELRMANEELERRVEERTADLSKANGKLQAEMNERRRAEQSLAESEKHFRHIVETAQEGIWMLDAQAKTSYVNNRMAELLGYSADEMLGLSMYDFMDDGARLEAERNFQKRREGIKERHDFRFRRKDGTDLWAILSTSPIMDDNDVFMGAVGLVTDITDRRRAEQSLEQSEKDYRALFEQAHDAIIVFNPEHEIVLDVNESACQIYGFTRDEFVGMSLKTISKNQTNGAEKVRKTLEADKNFSFESVQKRKDGSEMYLEVNASPVNYQGQQAIITVNRDITDRRQTEEALRASERRFRELVEMLPVAVYVCDASGGIESFNPRAVELWGRTPKYKDIVDSFCGAYKIYNLDGEFMPHAECPMAQVLQSGIPVANAEIVMERPDDTRRTAMVNVIPRYDEFGKLNGAINCLVDITDRKQAEVALRQSEASLAAAQRIAHLGSWELYILDIEDASKNPVHCSDEVYRIFGYEPGQIEVTGEVFYGFVQPQERARISKALFEAVEQRKNLNIEFPIVLPDGSERIIYGQAEVVYDEQSNKPLKFIGTVQDITERKQAEKKANEASERFRFLAESMPQKIFTARPNGEVDYYNRQWLDFSGLLFEQIIDWGWTQFIHPEDLEPTAQTWRHSVETGEEFETEHRVRRKDGEYRWHLSRACPMRGDDGKVLMWIGSNTDIHEQKLVQEELKIARLQLETALDAGAIATWNIDILNNRVVADKNMAQLYSVPLEEAASSPVESYIRAVHPDDRQQVEEDLAKAIASGDSYEMSYRIIKSDGSIRWVEARGQIERDENGKATQMLGVSMDITERVEAEKALLESEERLQQSQKMEAIGTLTGGVAHDFNNLLTAILGNTQLAQRKLSADDPIRLRLSEVTDAGNRAAELTRKLLAFSRRQHLTRHTINVNDSIAEIVTLLNRIIGEDVEMSVKYAADLPAVYADAGQIEQVVMNLAVNARDAMPTGGKLTIETSNVELDENYCRQYPYVLPGKYVQIRVSDSGTGMDEETQAHVFEPYFTTKEVGKGTGLGLSMAYGIIKQHDGHINLYSELGDGTTFKVYLPADKKAVEEKPQAIPISFLGGSETILVAEDEEPLRILAKHTLEDLGYTVLLAKNGEEAVEIFGAHRGRIDLFLSDVIMPRMGGSEAYERIREMGGNIPLIFMTGYSSETVQSRFIKSNATAEQLGAVVIQKPYTLEELGRLVREVLDKNQNR